MTLSNNKYVDGRNGIIEIDYYNLNKVDKDVIMSKIDAAVSALSKQTLGNAKDEEEFVKRMFETDDVCDCLIYLSKLPVFSKEFAVALKHNLDLLALVKKLKYFTNLSLQQNAILFKNLTEALLSSPITGMQSQVDKLLDNTDFGRVKVKDFMIGQSFENAKKYLDNNVALEKIDPHAVYPTSISRVCDGFTMATPTSQTIEAVMSTTLTTTIKITRKILDPDNKILAEIYRPLGRCVAVIDDKVEGYFGEQISEYFSANNIELVKLVHAGNEVNKDVQNVEQILLEMKKHGVSRNEPVLIVGGGVIADIGGFATGLYHRNTPYIMLCTSIVSGIDAGPSPRTCCDGYGYKNLYGVYHPPILTLTDRYFWKTLHEGWVRHGIGEIIKMACVKDFALFEMLEKAGPKLIKTKFGTVGCEDDQDFQDLCDAIVGRAMESYVRSEYGNLWETHQCRPHAFGHTWSPGYELPGGILHGHAVATCMGYSTYLSYKRDWISKADFQRVLNLISVMELALWHPIMDKHELVITCHEKMVQKRGGNICAPAPRTEIGSCGYINDHFVEDIPRTMNEYKDIVTKMVREGLGVDVQCEDVGLEDPSTVASNQREVTTTPNNSNNNDVKQITLEEIPTTYEDWIKAEQVKRNSTWEKNVLNQVVPDTDVPTKFDKFCLFEEGVEAYAMAHTTLSSNNVQYASTLTEDENLFMPCMVGAMESQFLKMQCQIKGAKRCLDIGTFTGMSAIAMAEGIPEDGKVVTLECYENIAKVAQKIFDKSTVKNKIELVVGKAADEMTNMVEKGDKFDLIFIDADKENYIEYYEIGLKLLAKGGIMLADNSLCALLYDQEGDMRSTRLHLFNQHVKNDPRTEQVVLTMREGITLIKPVVVC